MHTEEAVVHQWPFELFPRQDSMSLNRLVAWNTADVISLKTNGFFSHLVGINFNYRQLPWIYGSLH